MNEKTNLQLIVRLTNGNRSPGFRITEKGGMGGGWRFAVCGWQFAVEEIKKSKLKIQKVNLKWPVLNFKF